MQPAQAYLPERSSGCVIRSRQHKGFIVENDDLVLPRDTRNTGAGFLAPAIRMWRASPGLSSDSGSADSFQSATLDTTPSVYSESSQHSFIVSYKSFGITKDTFSENDSISCLPTFLVFWIVISLLFEYRPPVDRKTSSSTLCSTVHRSNSICTNVMVGLGTTGTDGRVSSQTLQMCVKGSWAIYSCPITLGRCST